VVVWVITCMASGSGSGFCAAAATVVSIGPGPGPGPGLAEPALVLGADARVDPGLGTNTRQVSGNTVAIRSG